MNIRFGEGCPRAIYMGKAYGEQVRVERSLNYQHPKAGGLRAGVGPLASGGKNHGGGVGAGLQPVPHQGANWLPGTPALSPRPAPPSLPGSRGSSFSHVASCREPPTPISLTLSLTSKVHFLLLPGCHSPLKSLSCRFLGDMPSPCTLF